jgi:AbrB family looped-hinge helix DNA binding protein
MQVTIDKAGRLVIPKKVREKAHIKPGMKLDIRVDNGVIEIEPAPVPVKLVRDGRFLVFVSPPGTPPLTHEMVEQTRQEIYSERERAFLGLEWDADLPS